MLHTSQRKGAQDLVPATMTLKVTQSYSGKVVVAQNCEMPEVNTLFHIWFGLLISC